MSKLSPLILFFMLLASGMAQAMPEAPPPHSLSPQLSGLNISTFVKKDRIKIALYVINHEKFEVLCDAQYRSGPDKQEASEVTIPAGKADAFHFTFGRRGDNVLLDLICVDPRKESTPTGLAPVNPVSESTLSPDTDNPDHHDTH